MYIGPNWILPNSSVDFCFVIDLGLQRMKSKYYSETLAYLIASIVSITICNGQVTLRGSVIDDQNDEPLIGASILLEGTSKGAVTDFDGLFELTVENLPVTLLVSYLGYKDSSIIVSQDNDDLSIRLTGEDGITLAVTEVTGQRISEKQKAAF